MLALRSDLNWLHSDFMDDLRVRLRGALIKIVVRIAQFAPCRGMIIRKNKTVSSNEAAWSEAAKVSPCVCMRQTSS